MVMNNTFLWRIMMRFRLRSSKRDQDADARRLSSIEQALSLAIADANSEKDGLQRRLNSTRHRASALLGNGTLEYSEREPQHEQLLIEEERDLIAGEKRIQQLGAHIKHLAKMLELLNQK
jgi:hypothetical protein